MRKLVLFGIGKIGQVAYHHFSTDSDYEVTAFAVDQAFIPADKHFDGLPVIPFEEIEKHYPPAECDLFIAVGYQQLNRLRAERLADAQKKGYRLATYISSQNKHLKREQVGDNCFVMSGEPLQPHARIGDNCFIWTNALIGHHTQVGSHCWITSGVVIGGNCRIGDYGFFGLGATIGHEVTIGVNSLVGAGALITKDAPENSVYIQPETERFRLTSQQFLKMNTLK
jgi:sugar O-acyltransferase (sialic acid O-acetyltransferase NeuD family)